MGDFLMVSTERNSDPLGVGTRQKKAKSNWLFSTQVTLLLACELVTTKRNKCYKGGDRSELVSRKRTYEQGQALCWHHKKSLLVRDFFVLNILAFFE